MTNDHVLHPIVVPSIVKRHYNLWQRSHDFVLPSNVIKNYISRTLYTIDYITIDQWIICLSLLYSYLTFTSHLFICSKAIAVPPLWNTLWPVLWQISHPTYELTKPHLLLSPHIFYSKPKTLLTQFLLFPSHLHHYFKFWHHPTSRSTVCSTPWILTLCLSILFCIERLRISWFPRHCFCTLCRNLKIRINTLQALFNLFRNLPYML